MAPGVFASMRKQAMPFAPVPASVCTQVQSRSTFTPLLTQALLPFTTQPDAVLSACVLIDVASLPAPGSVKRNPPIVSPHIRPGR